MARRYDARTTIFSPEGRLYQVEYAMEAINHAGACIGILAKDGVILAAEKRHANKLLDEDSVLEVPPEENTRALISSCEKVRYSEKIYKVLDNVVCGMAGFTSDANVLTHELRVIAQKYSLQFGLPVPCELLVSWICDIKHSYTQYGGKRPFGVSILYAGWDENLGFQLYHSDPSGNFSGWKACCIGQNNAAAMSSLENDYRHDIDVSDALAMAVRTIAKSVDSNKLTADKLELATLTRENNRCQLKFLSCDEIKSLIDTNQIRDVGDKK